MKIFVAVFAFFVLMSSSFALPIFHTEQGLIECKEHATYIDCRGIPYAEAGRWEEPRPPLKQQGVFKADKYGAISMQPGFSLKGGIMGGKAKGSENSQFINIVVPKKRSLNKMPVLLWVHGGAHVMGDASQSGFYDISRLAREGQMIVASINYRLGLLGNLAHEDLKEESLKNGGHGSTGNYGTLDVIQSLIWIQTNIESFGGDINNVTVMGESAGANLVRILIASPLAKGLFNKAIPLSGPDMELKLSESLNQTEVMIEELRGEGMVSSDVDNIIAQLRAIRAQTLVEKFPMSTSLDTEAHMYKYSPAVDGVVLPDMAHKIIQDGQHNKVDVMTMTTGDEMNSLQYAFGKLMPEVVGDKEFKQIFSLLISEERAEEILAFYKAQGDLINKKTLLVALGDAMFLAPKQKLADDMVKYGNKVYSGTFSKEIAVLGSGHAAVDLPHIFGWQFMFSPLSYAVKIQKGMDKMTENWGAFGHLLKPAVVINHMRPSVMLKHVYEEHKHAAQVRQLIYNFVHTGDPNQSFDGKEHKGLPYWVEYGETGQYLNINHKTYCKDVSEHPRAKYIQFLQELSSHDEAAPKAASVKKSRAKPKRRCKSYLTDKAA